MFLINYGVKQLKRCPVSQKQFMSPSRVSTPVNEISDPVFSQGVLGPSFGIEPEGKTVCAPFAGTVTQAADTKHAVGLRSADGMELLIHVGMDTVDMNGKGFCCYVKEGAKVSRGQKLMSFTIADIKARPS